ncbi:MAG TPA: BON domain-containing protein [Polyangiaceae bacterium]|nr:BON domain-containing protein [Polyangiaceae bacterium]
MDCDRAYLPGHIKEALATDERTHMLDVNVVVTDAQVILMGIVPCQRRRLAAEQVALELIPAHMTLVNSLCVENYKEPTETEHLG